MMDNKAHITDQWSFEDWQNFWKNGGDAEKFLSQLEQQKEVIKQTTVEEGKSYYAKGDIVERLKKLNADYSALSKTMEKTARDTTRASWGASEEKYIDDIEKSLNYIYGASENVPKEMAEQLNKARASLNSLIVNAKVGHGIKSPAVSSETYLKHLDTSFAASKSNFLAMGNSSPLQAGAVGKAMQKLQERYATSTEQLVRETESNFQRIQADAIRIKSDAIKATEGINKINEDRTKFLSKIKFKDTKGNLGNTVKLDDTKSFWEAFTNNANVQQLLETVVGLDTETTGLIEKASAVPVTLGLGSIGKNAVAGGKGVKNWVLSYGDTGKTAAKLIDAMNVGIENGVGSIKESAKQLRAQLGYTESDTVAIAKNNTAKIISYLQSGSGRDLLMTPDKLLEEFSKLGINSTTASTNLVSYNGAAFDYPMLQRWVNEYVQNKGAIKQGTVESLQGIFKAGKKSDLYELIKNENLANITGANKLEFFSKMLEGISGNTGTAGQHSSDFDVEKTLQLYALHRYSNAIEQVREAQMQQLKMTFGDVEKAYVNGDRKDPVASAASAVEKVGQKLQGIFGQKDVRIQPNSGSSLYSASQSQAVVEEFIKQIQQDSIQGQKAVESLTGKEFRQRYADIGRPLNSSIAATGNDMFGIGTTTEKMSTLVQGLMDKGYHVALGWDKNADNLYVNAISDTVYDANKQLADYATDQVLSFTLGLAKEGRVKGMVNNARFGSVFRNGKVYSMLEDRASTQFEEAIRFLNSEYFNNLSNDAIRSQIMQTRINEGLMGSVKAGDEDEWYKSNAQYSGLSKGAKELFKLYQTDYSNYIEGAYKSKNGINLVNEYLKKEANTQAQKTGKTPFGTKFNPYEDGYLLEQVKTAFQNVFTRVGMFGENVGKQLFTEGTLEYDIAHSEGLKRFLEGASNLIQSIGEYDTAQSEGARKSYKLSSLDVGDIYGLEKFGDVLQRSPAQGRALREFTEAAKANRMNRLKTGFSTVKGNSIGFNYATPEEALYGFVRVTDEEIKEAIKWYNKGKPKASQYKMSNAETIQDTLIASKELKNDLQSYRNVSTQGVLMKDLKADIGFMSVYGDLVQALENGAEEVLFDKARNTGLLKFGEQQVGTTSQLEKLKKLADGSISLQYKVLQNAEGRVKTALGFGGRLGLANDSQEELFNIIKNWQKATKGLTDETAKKISGFIPQEELSERKFMPVLKGEFESFVAGLKEAGVNAQDIYKGLTQSQNEKLKPITSVMKKLITGVDKNGLLQMDPNINKNNGTWYVNGENGSQIPLFDTVEAAKQFFGHYNELFDNIYNNYGLSWEQQSKLLYTSIGQHDVAEWAYITGAEGSQTSVKAEARFNQAVEKGLNFYNQFFNGGVDALRERYKNITDNKNEVERRVQKEFATYQDALSSFTSQYKVGANDQVFSLGTAIGSDAISLANKLQDIDLAGKVERGVVSEADYNKLLMPQIRQAMATANKKGNAVLDISRFAEAVRKNVQKQIVLADLEPSKDKAGNFYISDLEKAQTNFVQAYSEWLSASEADREAGLTNRTLKMYDELGKFYSDQAASSQSDLRDLQRSTHLNYSGYAKGAGQLAVKEGQANFIEMSASRFMTMRSASADATEQQLRDNIKKQLLDYARNRFKNNTKATGKTASYIDSAGKKHRLSIYQKGGINSDADLENYLNTRFEAIDKIADKTSLFNLQNAILQAQVSDIQAGNNRYFTNVSRFPYNQGNEDLLARTRIGNVADDEVKITQGIAAAIKGDFDGDLYGLWQQINGEGVFKNGKKFDPQDIAKALKVADENEARVNQYYDAYVNNLERMAASRAETSVVPTKAERSKQLESIGEKIFNQRTVNYLAKAVGDETFAQTGMLSNIGQRYRSGLEYLKAADRNSEGESVGTYSVMSGNGISQEKMYTALGEQFEQELVKEFLRSFEQDAISSKKIYKRVGEALGGMGLSNSQKTAIENGVGIEQLNLSKEQIDVVRDTFERVRVLENHFREGDFKKAISQMTKMGLFGSGDKKSLDAEYSEKLRASIGAVVKGKGPQATQYGTQMLNAIGAAYGITNFGDMSQSINIPLEMLEDALGVGKSKAGLRYNLNGKESAFTSLPVQVQEMMKKTLGSLTLSPEEALKDLINYGPNTKSIAGGIDFKGNPILKAYYGHGESLFDDDSLYAIAKAAGASAVGGASGSDKNSTDTTNITSANVVINATNAQVNSGTATVGGTGTAATVSSAQGTTIGTKGSPISTTGTKANVSVMEAGQLNGEIKAILGAVSPSKNGEHTYQVDGHTIKDTTTGSFEPFNVAKSSLMSFEEKQRAEVKTRLGTFAHELMDAMIKSGATSVEELKGKDSKLYDSIINNVSQSFATSKTGVQDVLGDKFNEKVNEYIKRAEDVRAAYSQHKLFDSGIVTSEKAVAYTLGEKTFAGTADLFGFKQNDDGNGFQMFVGDQKFSQDNSAKTFTERLTQLSTYFNTFKSSIEQIYDEVNKGGYRTNKQFLTQLENSLGITQGQLGLFTNGKFDGTTFNKKAALEVMGKLSDAADQGKVYLNRSFEQNGQEYISVREMKPLNKTQVSDMLKYFLTGGAAGGIDGKAVNFEDFMFDYMRDTRLFTDTIYARDANGNLVKANNQEALQKMFQESNKAEFNKNRQQAMSQYIRDIKQEYSLLADINKAKKDLQGMYGPQRNAQEQYIENLTQRYIATKGHGYTVQKGEGGLPYLYKGNEFVSPLTPEEAQKIEKAKADAAGKYTNTLAKQNVQYTKQIGLMGTIKKFTKSMGAYAVQSFMYRMSGMLTQGLAAAIKQIQSLDASIVNLQIATGKTRQEITSMLHDFNDLAMKTGRTTQEVSSAANDWLRAGYAGKEAATLTEASMQLSTLGMIDSAQATNYLISVLKGWKITAEEVTGVVDRLTAVDMAAAVDAGSLAEAMSRANNSAQLARVGMNDYIGYITTVAEVTQKAASSVGESFKTLFSRFGNVKARKFIASAADMESEDYNEADWQDLNDIEKVLRSSQININLRTKADTFRDVDEVFAEIGDKWDTYSNVTQNAIATAIAGVRQRENVVTLFENWDLVSKYSNIAANSLGTAAEKMNAYSDSIQAAKNRLVASLEETMLDLGGQEVIKNLLDQLSYLTTHLGEFATVILGYLMLFKGNAVVQTIGNTISSLSTTVTKAGMTTLGLGPNPFSNNIINAKNESGLGNFLNNSFITAKQNLYGQAIDREILALGESYNQLNQNNIMQAKLTASMGMAQASEDQKLLSSIMLQEIDLQKIEQGFLGVQTQLSENLVNNLLLGVDEELIAARTKDIESEYSQAHQGQKLTEAQIRAQIALEELAKRVKANSQVYNIAGNNLRASYTNANPRNVAALGALNLVGSLGGYYVGSTLAQNYLGEKGQLIGGLGGSLLYGAGLSKVLNLIREQGRYKNQLQSIRKEIYEDMIKQQYTPQVAASASKQAITSSTVKNEAVAAAGLTGLSAKAATATRLGGFLLKSIPYVAIAGLIFGVVKSIASKQKQERIETAETRFKKLSETETSIKSQEANAIEYDKLAKGVDSLGRNISLTDEEYEKFLDLRNQIGEAVPELIDHVDNAGNSILKLGENAESVSDTLAQLKQSNTILEAKALVGEYGTGSAEEFAKSYKEWQDKYNDVAKEMASGEYSINGAGVYKTVNHSGSRSNIFGLKVTNTSGNYSALEEELKNYAKDNNIPFYVSPFNTTKEGLIINPEFQAHAGESFKNDLNEILSTLNGAAKSFTTNELDAAAQEYKERYDAIILNTLGYDKYNNLSEEERLLYERTAMSIRPVEGMDETAWKAKVGEIVEIVRSQAGNLSTEVSDLLFNNGNGLTGTEFESAYNLGKTYVANIIGGIKDITPELAKSIAEAFGFSWEFKGTEDEFKEVLANGNISDFFSMSNPIEQLGSFGAQLSKDFSVGDLRQMATIMQNATGEFKTAESLINSFYNKKYKDSPISQIATEFERLNEIRPDDGAITDEWSEVYEQKYGWLLERINSLSDIYDIDGTLEEKIKQLKILTGKTLQGDIIETPEQIKTKYEAYGKFYDYFKKGDFKGEFSAEQLNEMMQYDDLKPYIADAFNGDSSGLQNAIEKYRQNATQLYKESVFEELSKDKNASAEIIKNNKEMFDDFSEKYGFDFTKFDTLNEGKVKLNFLAQLQMEMDSGDWVDKMAEYYGVDLDNFADKQMGKVKTFRAALADIGLLEEAEAAWKNSDEAKAAYATGDYKAISAARSAYLESYYKQGLIDYNFAEIDAEWEKLTGDLSKELNVSLTGTDYSEEAAKLWEAYESALVKEFAENQVRVKLGVDASVDDYGKAMDAEYYSEMRKALNNEIKIYKSKANTTTEEGLQYTQKLREAQVKLNNLDDEEIQDKIDLLKLQGANLNAITQMQKELVGTADTEKEYYEYVKQAYEARKAEIDLIEKERELLNKDYLLSTRGGGTIADYYKGMAESIAKQIKEMQEEIKNAKANALSQEEILELKIKVQNLFVEADNLDDEIIEDTLSFLQNIEASQSAIVKQYQQLLTTADSDQERLEYEQELNKAILDRMKLEKELFEFEKKIMDYEMEYFKGLPESKNYTNQLDKMIKNLESQVSKSKEILQKAYNNAYQGVVRGYQNAIDAEGNRLYSDSDIQKLINNGTIDEEAQQNSDYQDAMTNYIEAQQALGDLYIEDFNNKINAIERRIKELETSKANEWSSDWSKEEGKVIKSATEKMKEYYSKLDEYYQQEAKAAMDTLTKYADVITDEQIEELVSKYNDAMKIIRDNSIQLHEDIKNYQESVYGALINEVGRYKDQLEEQKRLVAEHYDEELEKLGDKQQSIQRTNQLIELQNQLLSAQKEKERVYREGIGWVYESPRNKIKDANKALDDFTLQDQINDLQNAKDAELKALNDMIQNWDDYLKMLETRYNEFDRLQEQKLLKELLGVETEEEIQAAIKADMLDFTNYMKEHTDDFFTDQINAFSNFNTTFGEFLNEYKTNLQTLYELNTKGVETKSADKYLPLNDKFLDTQTPDYTGEKLLGGDIKKQKKQIEYTPEDLYDIVENDSKLIGKSINEKYRDTMTGDFVDYSKVILDQITQGDYFQAAYAGVLREEKQEHNEDEYGSSKTKTNEEKLKQWLNEGTISPEQYTKAMDAIAGTQHENALAVENAVNKINQQRIQEAIKQGEDNAQLMQIESTTGQLVTAIVTSMPNEFSQASQKELESLLLASEDIGSYIDKNGLSVNDTLHTEMGDMSTKLGDKLGTLAEIIQNIDKTLTKEQAKEIAQQAVTKASSGGAVSGGGEGGSTSSDDNGWHPVAAGTKTEAGDTSVYQGMNEAQTQNEIAYLDSLIAGGGPNAQWAQAQKDAMGWATGIERGPVTKTGYAMLHGSPTSPEYVLNTDQAGNVLKYIGTHENASNSLANMVSSLQQDTLTSSGLIKRCFEKIFGNIDELNVVSAPYIGLSGIDSNQFEVTHNKWEDEYLRNMATARMPQVVSNNTISNDTYYEINGDIVLENCDNPAEFWDKVTAQMGNRWNVTKRTK